MEMIFQDNFEPGEGRSEISGKTFRSLKKLFYSKIQGNPLNDIFQNLKGYNKTFAEIIEEPNIDKKNIFWSS